MSTIQIKDYTKKLKGVTVLENINLLFESGKIYGIQGHNGCGKTMLLRAISGLIHATSGCVIINEKELHKEIDFPQSIGVLIEHPEFWKSYTGFEVLELLAGIKNKIGKSEIEEVLKRVGLSEKKDIAVAKYSLGMRQRLGIAQAIMEKPDIILLDEPSNALDKEGTQLFYNILKEEKSRGAVIILVSHSLSDLQTVCDKIITMEHGKIIDEEVVKFE